MKNKVRLGLFLNVRGGWMSQERPDTTVAESWGKGSPGSHCVECGQGSPATAPHPLPPESPHLSQMAGRQGGKERDS